MTIESKNYKIFQKELIQKFKSEDPETWKKIHPREYEPVPSHHDPKFVALDMYLTLKDFDGIDDARKRYIGVISFLVRDTVPTYYISENLLRSIWNTKLPDELVFGDIQYPLPSFMIMLPKTDWFPKFSSLMFAKTVIGEEVNIPGTNVPFITQVQNKYYFCALPSTDSDMRHIMVTSAHGKQKINTLENIVDLSVKEVELMSKIHGLTVKICLSMIARPELVEHKSIGRKVKIKKQSKILWDPKWVGRKYHSVSKLEKKKETPSELTRLSPRSYWYPGCFRHVKYGPKHSKTKILWIEPYFVVGRGLE